MGLKNYTDKQLAKIIKKSFSYAEVLKKIKIISAGGNYATLKKRIKIASIDISHFTGQGHLKGKTHNWAAKIPLNEILIKDSTYGGGTFKLKKRLFKEGLLEQKCYKCGLTQWFGESISLELEHKNGDRFDNRIENLTILCPNCHSQTKTYRGKNIKKNK